MGFGVTVIVPPLAVLILSPLMIVMALFQARCSAERNIGGRISSIQSPAFCTTQLAPTSSTWSPANCSSTPAPTVNTALLDSPRRLPETSLCKEHFRLLMQTARQQMPTSWSTEAACLITQLIIP